MVPWYFIALIVALGWRALLYCCCLVHHGGFSSIRKHPPAVHPTITIHRSTIGDGAVPPSDLNRTVLLVYLTKRSADRTKDDGGSSLYFYQQFSNQH